MSSLRNNTRLGLEVEAELGVVVEPDPATRWVAQRPHRLEVHDRGLAVRRVMAEIGPIGQAREVPRPAAVELDELLVAAARDEHRGVRGEVGVHRLANAIHGLAVRVILPLFRTARAHARLQTVQFVQQPLHLVAAAIGWCVCPSPRHQRLDGIALEQLGVKVALVRLRAAMSASP
jgi:hypothetical protein